MPRFRIFRRSERQLPSRQNAQSPPIFRLLDEDPEEAWLRRFIDDATSPFIVAAASIRAAAGSTSSRGSDALVNYDTDSNDGDSMTTTTTGTRQPAVSYANAPFQCPICFDAVRQATVPICGHVFCQQCIKTCVRHGSSVCPICRGSLLTLTRVYDIDKVMDAYFVSVRNGGGPIFVTPRPIAFGDQDQERISVQGRFSLKQRVQTELAHILWTFQFMGWMNGIRLIFKRIFFIIRLTFRKTLVIGILCGAMITIGIVLCHVAQLPQICPPYECHLKMTAWEHLVAAIRSLLGLVPVPEPAFEIRYPQVVQPQVFDDVLEYIQAKLNAFGKLLNY